MEFMDPSNPSRLAVHIKELEVIGLRESRNFRRLGQSSLRISLDNERDRPFRVETPYSPDPLHPRWLFSRPLLIPVRASSIIKFTMLGNGGLFSRRSEVEVELHAILTEPGTCYAFNSPSYLRLRVVLKLIFLPPAPQESNRVGLAVLRYRSGPYVIDRPDIGPHSTESKSDISLIVSALDHLYHMVKGTPEQRSIDASEQPSVSYTIEDPKVHELCRAAWMILHSAYCLHLTNRMQPLLNLHRHVTDFAQELDDILKQLLAYNDFNASPDIMEIMLRVAKLVVQGAAAFDTLNAINEPVSRYTINTGLFARDPPRKVLPESATTTLPWTYEVGASESTLLTQDIRSTVDREYKGTKVLTSGNAALKCLQHQHEHLKDLRLQINSILLKHPRHQERSLVIERGVTQPERFQSNTPLTGSFPTYEALYATMVLHIHALELLGARRWDSRIRVDIAVDGKQQMRIPQSQAEDYSWNFSTSLQPPIILVEVSSIVRFSVWEETDSSVWIEVGYTEMDMEVILNNPWSPQVIQVCTPEGAIKRVDALRCRLDLRGETPALAWQTPNSECIHDVHEREELLGLLTCTYEKLCALTSRTTIIPELYSRSRAACIVLSSVLKRFENARASNDARGAAVRTLHELVISCHSASLSDLEDFIADLVSLIIQSAVALDMMNNRPQASSSNQDRIMQCIKRLQCFTTVLQNATVHPMMIVEIISIQVVGWGSTSQIAVTVRPNDIVGEQSVRTTLAARAETEHNKAEWLYVSRSAIYYNLKIKSLGFSEWQG
ncbi:hypothetical protein BC629DRAFT_1509098 [Irpex lacteus]|nr:hypothetical protein BC629DRAFT_1509098 [Irpex lacteus]